MIGFESFAFLDVLGVTLQDGEERYRLGHSESDLGIKDNCVPWGWTGLVCIPDLPDADGACMARQERVGGQTVVTGTRDPRYANKIGSLPAGSRGFVTRGTARHLLNPERDQITSFAVQKSGGLSMMVDVDAEAETITLLNGNASIQIGDDSIALMINGGTTVLINGDGFFVNGNAATITTGAVYLGDLGGGTPPPGGPAPGPTSALVGIAGPTGAPSTKVFIAP